MKTGKINLIPYTNENTLAKNKIKRFGDEIFTNIKPIKTYTQYMKEYGLISKSEQSEAGLIAATKR